MKKHLSLLFIVLFLFAVTACDATDANTAATAESKATATATSEATATLPPSATATTAPTLRLTDLPTATPLPTATAVPANAYARVQTVSPVRNLPSRQPDIRIEFKDAMDRESVGRHLSVSPPVDLDLTWESDTVLIVRPEDPLTANVTYTFTIAKAAVNQAGVPFYQNWVRRFITPDTVSTYVPPSLERVQSEVQIRFSYEMDMAKAEDLFTIVPPAAGTFSWDEAGRVLTFVPDNLMPQTEYTIHFTGPLLDAHGYALPAPDDFVFTSPGMIKSVSHDYNTYYPGDPIRILFARPMDQVTTADAFYITPRTEGTITWEETTLIFTPNNGRFNDYTEYTYGVQGTATDSEGTALGSDRNEWRFFTDHYGDVADFGAGSAVQVVAANGRRAVHYRGYDIGQKDVTFHLYQLSPEAFASRYLQGNMDTSSLLLARTWQEQTRAEGDWNLNPQELIIPADVSPGPYILTLSGEFVNDEMFILLTHQNLVLKHSAEQLIAWVSDVNGDPVDGPAITVYNAAGEVLQNGRVDDDGLYSMAADSDASLVLVRDGNDVVISGFGYPWQRRGGSVSQTDYYFHITTDRPIYRPGHTVYFKGIIRQDDDATLSHIPEGTVVTVRIRDARSNRVQTFELTANDYGTVNGQFQIAPGAMLGNYGIEMSLNGDSEVQTFKVQDYRKPDYQVSVTTEESRYLSDETIEVTVESSYFFGDPVPMADLTLTLYHQDYGDYWYESDSINGHTDANGRFVTTVTVDWSGTWLIEAVVDDGSHQGVAGQKRIQAFDRAESIHLTRGRYIKSPNEPFTLEATVTDIWGDAVSNRTVTVELRRYSYRDHGYEVVEDSFTAETDANGRVRAALTPSAGYYKVIAFAQDRRGQRIQTNTWIVAYQRDYYGQWYGSSDALSIYPDKEEYQFEETAQIYVESTISGPALLTVERGDIYSQQLVELTAPITTLEVPITIDYAPNVYVTIQTWKPLTNTIDGQTSYSIPDSELIIASTNLKVPAVHKQLAVTITPDRTQYAPGETATFTVRTTNFIGDPVSSEISLAVVDEAIFSLSRVLVPNMYDTFYFDRNNGIFTYDSMRPSRSLWLPYEGGMGGGGGDGNIIVSNPRTDFQDTAAWFPTLRTDANGEVVVSVTLPDNLTSWRLTARATTADTQVGETVTHITTHQDIIIRPLLPRTLTAGDTLNLSAVVHNYSDEAQTLDVSLTAHEGMSVSLTIDGDLTQTVTIPAGGLMIVGWPVSVPTAGDIDLTMAAVGEADGDAVRLPLHIQPLAIPDVSTQVGQFTDELVTTVEIPADALAMSEVNIDLSRSIAGSLLEGAEYLTGYPYGCVEQTMSRALPNAVVGRALFQLGMADPIRFGELDAMIMASIQRLYGFQHDDGGWGWWYTDPSHDYQTAWVVFGLTVTADAGYEIDPLVIERGATWLNEHLLDMDIRTRAFALYSMAVAGHGNLEATTDLTTLVKGLDTFSRAALALALDELDQTAAAREVVDQLIGTVTTAGQHAYWQGETSDGYYRRKTMASDTRNTALALSALIQVRPGHALEGSVVRWLMAQRREYGWGTTNETAFALLALTDHVLGNPATSSDTDYTVWLNDEVIETGTLGRERPSINLRIPVTMTHAGTNDLRITQSGGGQLYYVINNRVYVAEEAIESAGVINVQRVYIDPNTNRVIEEIHPGDVVQVRLLVEMPDDASYMIVEDKLPGGFEALNEALDTTSAIANTTNENQRSYTYKETFGDRVSFFITDMEAGTHVLVYFARATHIGDFVAMPTEAYAMYDMTIWGRSASRAVSIK